MGNIFTEQVSTNAYLEALLYIISCVGVIVAFLGVVLLDVGVVQPKNLLDTITQKIAGGLIGGAAFIIFGYGVWNIQFYQALGVPNAVVQSLADYGLFGPLMTTSAAHLDPAMMPTAETQQVFAGFFFLFAMLTCALLHGAGLERMRALPYYIVCVLTGAIIMPILVYATYGSAGLLTNAGLHDFVGTYSLYVFVGTWSVVQAWKLGPRLVIPKAPSNILAVAAGGLTLMIGITMFVPGCGFFQPGHGYFGATTGDSSLGLTFLGIFLAFAGGGVGGTLVGYVRRAPVYIILGPVAGYVSCSCLFDLAKPWQDFLVASLAPLVMLLTETIMRRAALDETKLVPVALGPGIYSCLAAGVIGGGTRLGGYFGVKTGDYAYHHATISLGLQAVGLVLVIGATAVLSFIVLTVLDRTVGLRVTRQQELDGLDQTYWGRPSPSLAPAPGSEGHV